MNSVFVVFEEMDYEYTDVYGIYDNEYDALDVCSELTKKETDRTVHYRVEEYLLNTRLA